MRLELIRYAMFGSEALRGKSDDYQSLEVSLRLRVGDLDYLIHRNKKVTIHGCDEQDVLLATGHRAVNAKVQEILGFGLDVFDIACCVCQGEVERLGAMMPAERKRMVDSTVGLGALDEVAKALAGEASELRQRAAGIREGASKPEEPVKPGDYEPSDNMVRFVEALREDVRRLVQARAFLAVPVREPEEPTRPCEESLEELEAYQLSRKLLETTLALNKGKLSATPAAVLGDDPDWLEAMHDQADRWEARERIRTQLASLRKVGVNTCPSCRHEWPIEAEALSRAAQELETYADVPRRVTRPTVTRQEIAKRRHAIERADERAELQALVAEQEAELAAIPDRSRDVQAMRDYLTAVQRYSRDLTAYMAWEVEAEGARVSVANLGAWAEDHLRRGEEQLHEAQVYEKILGSYQVALRRYDQAIKQAEALEAEAAQLALARKALAELRVRVKQQFTPLLAKAASTLVQRMSGGAYSSITIDDDFEITLDGQALRTLSGAGKAIANLAVRLGLGVVLTRGVLPVLLADEVDAAMDAENATSTATCIRGLADTLKQVILVSHKRLEADHYVEL